MSTALDPIVSGLQTEEQAANHGRWLLAEVEKALANCEPRSPHDQVMAEMRALIESKRKKPTCSRSSKS